MLVLNIGSEIYEEAYKCENVIYMKRSLNLDDSEIYEEAYKCENVIYMKRYLGMKCGMVGVKFIDVRM
jgi:hypothetical protein